jgi:hypothetical protein
MFVFSARGRIYEVVTRALDTVVRFPGHWMYEPSVLTPSPLTRGRYLMLFSSNLFSGKDIDHGEAIFLSSSPDGHSQFTAPQAILNNTMVTDLCDLGDARPVWDGAQWHVYVYAVRGDYRSNQCSPTAGVFEAVGASLESLAWVTYAGTNQARPVAMGTGSAGIAEDMQWFFTAAYHSAGPFVATYNDWGSPDAVLLVNQSDGTDTVEPWYEMSLAQGPDGGAIVLPDAILAGTSDAAVLGDPAIGLESNCGSGNGQYQYVKGIALYSDLTPSADRPFPTTGAFFPGPVESVSNDHAGPRMFRPRLARNEYGYIDHTPDTPGLPRTWQTYVYYNDAQVGSDGKCGYSRWFSSDQRFSVSYLEIREQ